MRFTTRQDIEAPLDFVFACLADFESWERAAMRRGADVSRTDRLRQTGVGATWAARFSYRGKPRAAEIRLTGLEPPHSLAFAGTSAAIDAEARVELMQLSARRTRIHVVLEVTPRSLTARIFLQSLRLARSRIDRKFEQRIAHLAADIAARHGQPRRR